MSTPWQRNYGRSEPRQGEDDLNDWIANIDIERRANNETSSFDLTSSDAAAAVSDSDVADVIAQMEHILNNTIDTGMSFNFNAYGIDEEDSYDSINDFAVEENIIACMHSQSKDRIKKRCFEELRLHRKCEKKRLGWVVKLVTKQQKRKLLSKYLLSWKAINRMIKVKQVLVACRIGRSTSKSFRSIFIEWKRLSMIRREQLVKVESRLRRKKCRQAFSALLANKDMALLAYDRARKFYAEKQKVKVLVTWLTVTRHRRNLSEKADQLRRLRLLRLCFVAWSSEACIVEATVQTTPADSDNNEVAVTKQSKQKEPSSTEDDEDLLKPLKKRRSRLGSKGKIILDINQRNAERQKRREALRSRHDAVALAKKQLLDAEMHRQEEQAFHVHNEFRRKKAEEKERKGKEAARQKEAHRLATLHYKISLQKRLFSQWKRIFGIKCWNERKAVLLYRDTTIEKYFRSWKKFVKNKALRLLKRQHLAVDFHEAGLYAKVFASLEENVKYTHQLQDQVSASLSKSRKYAVLREWHHKSLQLQEERDAKGVQAEQMMRAIFLDRALKGWKVGVMMKREEKRVEELVNEKYDAMMQWLKESRVDNETY
jgi:hypothetical protein